MTRRIEVDYDVHDRRLVIRCPFYANDLIKLLPSYRWSKSKKAWLVPLTKRNVERLRSDDIAPYCNVTEAAMEAMKKVDVQVRSGDEWPSWYTFKRQPRKHQMEALKKGYGLDAYALFMDMQTGKSKVAIDLCCAWRMEGKIDAVLILCKLTLRENWRDNWNDDGTVPWSMHFPDTARERQFEEWMAQRHELPILVVGFESLSQGRMHEMVERFLLAYPRVAIIADETTYIAGHRAIRSKRCVAFGRMASKRLALTGTPVADSPLNLFMQFEFLDPNIIGIGDYYAFRNRYAIMGGYRDPKSGKPMEVIGYRNMDELVKIISPNTFQVLKSEAYDLPPKRHQLRTVMLTKEQRELYNQIRKEGAYVLSHENSVPVVMQTALEVMLRLHQVAGGHAVRTKVVKRTKANGTVVDVNTYEPVEIVPPEHNPKVQEVMAVIEEARHKQGVIWCVYHPEIDAMRWALQHMGIKFGELHGRIPEKDRQPVVRALRNGDVQYILGNASTGGMGYPMPTAEMNIFYSNTFKYIDRAQAEDRSWGDQTKASPAYIDIVAERTVDVVIRRALTDKKDLSDYVRERLGAVLRLLDGEAGDDKPLDGGAGV